MRPEGVLGLEMRRRLFTTIGSYPGLHVRELARQLGTSVALVEYHLAVLRENSLVRIQEEHGYNRVFALGQRRQEPSPAERRLLATLRRKLPLRITLFLLDHERPVPHGALAEALDLGKSKLSFHLRNLEAAGVVRKAPDGGYEPVDRRHLLRLILENQPTPDVKQEFAELWLSLYGKT
jgi:DNA-binding transcriptional ArsR family regulator